MKKEKVKKINKVKLTMSILTVVSLILNMIMPVYATDDPISIINNLSDFIFSLTRSVGIIILIFGVVQIGMSYQSHDPSQRTNGVFTLVGGIIITCAKEIIGIIAGWGGLVEKQ